MAYEELNITATDGLEAIINFPNLDTPIVWPILLFVVYTVVALATYFNELKRESKGALGSSLAVAGFVTSAVAILLSLLQAISTQVLVYTIVLNCTFIVIYLLIKK